jgi:flagellar basal-body rod modification protein FlgD
MSVTGVTSTTSTPASPAAGATTATVANPKGTMGQTQFLNLLMAQLKNQDPLSPMDNTAFTGEMAQFSSLEQLTNINTNLSGLSQVTSSVNSSQAIGMIGKTIEAAGNTITMSSGVATPIAFNLPSATSVTDISITNSSGNVVATLKPGALSTGDQTIKWDGKDSNGTVLPDGAYTYSVNATAGNQAVLATTYTTGMVSSVSVQGGNISLNVGNSTVPLSSVIKVGL